VLLDSECKYNAKLHSFQSLIHSTHFHVKSHIIYPQIFLQMCAYRVRNRNACWAGGMKTQDISDWKHLPIDLSTFTFIHRDYYVYYNRIYTVTIKSITQELVSMTLELWKQPYSACDITDTLSKTEVSSTLVSGTINVILSLGPYLCQDGVTRLSPKKPFQKTKTKNIHS
jgi:hypothetical protein